MKTTLMCGNPRWHVFKTIASRPVRLEDAIHEQLLQGYPPNSFGFRDFESMPLADGTFQATWKCHSEKEIRK